MGLTPSTMNLTRLSFLREFATLSMRPMAALVPSLSHDSALCFDSFVCSDKFRPYTSELCGASLILNALKLGGLHVDCKYAHSPLTLSFSLVFDLDLDLDPCSYCYSS